MSEKKYYWLKLKRDFFKRHDIKIIEAMDNGKDYILFYLKLLCESVDHQGNLRFNEQIPYNEKMLATITNTNIDIVKNAMECFISLKMIDILDDKTIFMAEVDKLIGSETYWAEAKRKQRVGQSQDNVLLMSNMSNQEIDIEKDIDKEKDIKVCRFTPPTIDEIITYCKERKNNVNAQRFLDFYTSKGWLIGKNKMKDWKAAVRTWENNDKKSGNPLSSGKLDYSE